MLEHLWPILVDLALDTADHYTRTPLLGCLVDSPPRQTCLCLAVVKRDSRRALSVGGVPHIARGAVVRHIEGGAESLEAVALEEAHVGVEIVELG